MKAISLTVAALLIGITFGLATVPNAADAYSNRTRFYRDCAIVEKLSMVGARGLFLKSTQAIPSTGQIVDVKFDGGCVQYRVYDSSFELVAPGGNPPVITLEQQIIPAGSWRFWNAASQDYMSCLVDPVCWRKAYW